MTQQAWMMTNKTFSQKDKVFKQACKLTIVARTKEGTPITLAPTTRQASKFRNKKGLAYLKRKEAVDEISKTNKIV